MPNWNNVCNKKKQLLYAWLVNPVASEASTPCVSHLLSVNSFSALKRIKSYFRLTMTKQRLVDLAILSTECDIAQQLIIDVIDKFALSDRNRRITLV